MTSAEARAAFEAYVSSEPQRLAAFREAVAARGGPPVAALDLSRASLGPLGAWFLAPSPPGPEDATRPDWAAEYPDDDPSLGEAWLVDGLATYFGASLQRAHRGLEWRLDGDRRSQDQGRPVIVGFGQTHLWPIRPVNVKLHAAREAPTPDPDWLIRLFDTWSGFVPAGQRAAPEDAGDDPGESIDDVEVRPIQGDRDWDVEIWIPESAEATLGAAAFEGLEARLSAIDGIERLAWEDRERFLARLRPGTDLNTLREAVAAAMRSASTSR